MVTFMIIFCNNNVFFLFSYSFHQWYWHILIFILSYFLANSETNFACTLLLEAFLFSSTSPFKMRNYAKLNSNQWIVSQDCLPVLIIDIKQSLFQVIKVLWNSKVLVNHFLFQSKFFNTPWLDGKNIICPAISSIFCH